MKYMLIGGPKHGEEIESEYDNVRFMELTGYSPVSENPEIVIDEYGNLNDPNIEYSQHIYCKAVDGYMVHDSLVYSKYNNWYDLEKHYKNNIRPEVEHLNENTSVFMVDGLVLSFIHSDTLIAGACRLKSTKTWYNHEYAKNLDILHD